MTTLTTIVTEHIRRRWTARACPHCKANNWTLNGPFALLPATVDTSGYVNGYRTMDSASPVIAMVCRECGHTSLIDYNVMLGMEP